MAGNPKFRLLVTLQAGEPNDITTKDIVLKIQSMCKFYSQKGCQKGNNFGGLCENCPVFKFRKND